MNLGGTLTNGAVKSYVKPGYFPREDTDITWQYLHKVRWFCLCGLFSRLPVMSTTVWIGANSVIKLFSFSSTLVERFSVLAGYFIFNYFPNTRQMAGYLRTVRLHSSIKFDRQLTGLHPCVRRCLVRNTNMVLGSPL